jgi:hypothetical protein
MKKILVILTFIYCNALGQTVNINCLPSTPCFTNIEPGTISSYKTYSATLSGVEYDSVHYAWSKSGGNELNSPNSAAYSVWFPNTSNISSPKYVKVIVTYYKGGTEKPPVEKQETVTVKHIGAINTMTLNGTSVSNGGSHSISCGSQTVNVVLNGGSDVATDPYSAVTYTWEYPSGWSGSTSTSSPSVSLTADAGGAGLLKVTAKRNDGTTTQTFQVNITRPTVGTASISGANPLILCGSGTTTLTASATGTTTYTWTPIGTASIISGQGTSSITIGASSDGAGSFTVVPSNGCGNGTSSSPHPIWRGTPKITNATVDGGSLQYPNYVGSPGIMQIYANGGSNANWSILNGTGSVTPLGLTGYGYPNTFIRVYGQTYNTCGNGDDRTFYLQLTGSFMYKIASNPVKDKNLSIEFVDPVIITELLKEVAVFNGNNEKVLHLDLKMDEENRTNNEKKNITINTGNLKTGIYYLQLNIGDNIYKERILIE